MSTGRRGVYVGRDGEDKRIGRRWRSFGEAAAGTPGLIALMVMAVAGIAVALYLITVEAARVPLICSTTGLVDCASVLNSSYSRVPFTSVPITVPGMLWFVVSGAMAGVGLVWAWQERTEPPRLRLAQFLWSAAGMVFVLYLVYAEIVVLHRICAWCTVIHALTLATLLLTVYRLQQPDVAAAATYASARGAVRNARGRPGAGNGAPLSRRALARMRGRRQ